MQPDPSPPAAAPTVSFRAAFWTLWTATAGLLLAAVLQSEPLQSANDKSRWSTVWSLIERHTWQIDEIDARPDWTTIDKVRHEGHYYSSKPPLLTALFGGVYWVVRAITGWTLPDDIVAVSRTILIVTHVIPWLVALVLLGQLACRLIEGEFARLLFVGAACLGTLVNTFTTTLNNHVVAAASLVFALFAALVSVEAGASPRRAGLASAACGFFAAFTVTCELPAAIVAALLFVMIGWKSWKRALLAFAPAALVPLVAYFAFNVAATGGFKPFYAYYGTEKYRYEVDGVPSYWSNPTGTDKAVDSPAVYFLHCTIGHHGLLSLTPLWLLSLAGWWSLRRNDGSPLRPFLWMGLLANVVVLGFYMQRTENYNYGGHSAGLRWMVFLTPFWLIALIPPCERWGHCRWFRAAALVLLAASAGSAHVGLDNPWRQPWLYDLMRQAGWLKQYNPEPPPKFDHPLTTWFWSIPEPAAGDKTQGGAGPWVELAGTDVFGRRVTWRLQREPDRATGVASVRFTRATAGEPPIDVLFAIDKTAFALGKPPGEILVERDAETKQAAIPLLAGLPTPRTYREGSTRYLKSAARRDAFACRRAASRIERTPEGGQKTAWRTDLWLCEELPFGIARIEMTVTDAATGDTIQQQKLTVSAWSGSGN